MNKGIIFETLFNTNTDNTDNTNRGKKQQAGHWSGEEDAVSKDL